MKDAVSKADLLSIPRKLCELQGTVYDPANNLAFKVTSRAYAPGELTVGRPSPTPGLISMSADPEFHDHPRFSNILYKQGSRRIPGVLYKFAEVRVLFCLPRSKSEELAAKQGSVEDQDANKFALVRLYDRWLPSLGPFPTDAEQIIRISDYGDAMSKWEPNAYESVNGTCCMQLSKLPTFATVVIPLSWVVQDVMVIEDPNPRSDDRVKCFLNRWYHGKGAAADHT